MAVYASPPRQARARSAGPIAAALIYHTSLGKLLARRGRPTPSSAGGPTATMGRKAYLDSSDKLQRKLAKVERKRVLLRRLCSLQVLAVVPFGVFVSWSGEPVEGEPEPERSVLAYYQARSPPHPSLTATIARIPLFVCGRRRRWP